MPYLLKRDVASLNLKAGDSLKHEKGKLPSALKFDVYWKEPEVEKPKRTSKKATETE